jgi:hydroxymethylbilane synthase
MAVAALEILGLTEHIAERLDVETFVPAVGQGAVAVECRIDDAATIDALRAIDHGGTRHDVEVERAFLGELGSGCSLPVGGHVHDGRLIVFLADFETGRSVVASAAVSGTVDDLDVGRRAAQGAKEALR